MDENKDKEITIDVDKSDDESEIKIGADTKSLSDKSEIKIETDDKSNDDKSDTRSLSDKSDVSDLSISSVDEMLEENKTIHKIDSICINSVSDEESKDSKDKLAEQFKLFSKKAENMRDELNHFQKILDDCYAITIDFIKRRKLILTGGMMIDYALKLKGDKLYDTKKIDYDCISSNYHVDAYDLGNLLAKKYDNISVICAKHVSTMRVRYLFMSIADITYVPQNIFDKVKFLEYEGIRIIHPHMQMMDQLRAFRNMAENAPMEAYLSDRTEKDIKRFHMLSKYYGFTKAIIDSEYGGMPDVSKVKMIKRTVNIKYFDNCCLSGWIAVGYWLKKTGAKTNDEIIFSEVNRDEKNTISFVMPEQYPISYICDEDDHYKVFDKYNDEDIKSSNKSSDKSSDKKSKIKNLTAYNAFLDKLPEKVEFEFDGIQFEEYQAKGEKLVASKLECDSKTKDNKLDSKNQPSIHIMGLHGSLLWLLMQFLFFEDKLSLVAIRHLWLVICKDFHIPSPVEFYGKYNLSDSYLLALRKQRATMHGSQLNWVVPKNAYPKKGKTVDKAHYMFVPSKSDFIQNDGAKK